MEKMEDGKAIFELSRFTEAEIAKIESNGLEKYAVLVVTNFSSVRCIVTSENFEGKWESDELSYNILPDGKIALFVAKITNVLIVGK